MTRTPEELAAPTYDWAKWPWQRCPARTGPGPQSGQCDLRRHHTGDHALERGMDIPTWSTEWT